MVVHTAKAVEYSVLGFRIKNKDEIAKELDKCIGISGDEII